MRPVDIVRRAGQGIRRPIGKCRGWEQSARPGEREGAEGDQGADVNNGWQTKKLVDAVAAVSTGPFGSVLHKSDYVDDGVPLVNPINIIGERIVPDPTKLISDATRQRL